MSKEYESHLIEEIVPGEADELMRSSIEARLRSSTNGPINLFRYAAFCILEAADRLLEDSPINL